MGWTETEGEDEDGVDKMDSFVGILWNVIDLEKKKNVEGEEGKDGIFMDFKNWFLER